MNNTRGLMLVESIVTAENTKTKLYRGITPKVKDLIRTGHGHGLEMLGATGEDHPVLQKKGALRERC